MARKKQKNSYQTADEWMGRQSGGSTPGIGGTQSYGGMQTADEWMGANAGAELTLYASGAGGEPLVIRLRPALYTGFGLSRA